jgi:mannitol-specific phosphotransferase system IIBC component
MSPFWWRNVFTLFSAALVQGRRSLKKFDLKYGTHSGAALNRVNMGLEKYKNNFKVSSKGFLAILGLWNGISCIVEALEKNVNVLINHFLTVSTFQFSGRHSHIARAF